MKRKIQKGIVSMLLMSILIFSMLANLQSIGAATKTESPTTQMETTSDQNGPRASGLEIYFYNTPDHVYAALKSGEIDLMDWPLTYDQYYEATEDPNIILAYVAGLDMFQFDLNNNYTYYPGVRNPLNEIHFRQAIACMVDKDWIVNAVLKGFGDRIDVPIPYLLRDWWNYSVVGEDYPYKYNLDRAAELLDAGGFVDADDDDIRNYPLGWPGRERGPNLDPIKVCIRSDHTERLIIGRALCDNMRILGIPVNQIEAPKVVLNPMVIDDHNYQVYTGEWFRIYPIPEEFLYSAYHDDFYFPGGRNYVTGKNASGLPNYPQLNEYLEEMWYAPTIEDAKTAAKKAQGFIVENCITIALWSPRSYYAYRNLCGVVNMQGYGPYNIYTLMNAYRADDPNQPIRVGIWPPPISMNPLYVDSYDQRLLLPLRDEGIAHMPYHLANDNPWQIQDWEVGTWNDDDVDKSVVTYYLREGIGMVAPVSGQCYDWFEIDDFIFDIWFSAAFDDSESWGYLRDIDHTTIVNDNELKVFFSTNASIWDYLKPIAKIIPFDDLLKELLCDTATESWTQEATEQHELSHFVVQVVQAWLNDSIPLKEGVDYIIKFFGFNHNLFVPTRPLHGKITITYWYPAIFSAHGFYLDDLTWQQTLISKGPYYLIDFVGGAGGHAYYGANRWHFMPTPPLGEIDWWWYWIEGPKPRTGFFHIELTDVVYACIAYGGQGYLEPDPPGPPAPPPYWVAGCDLAPTYTSQVPYGGLIDIYDLTTTLINYDIKFGHTP